MRFIRYGRNKPKLCKKRNSKITSIFYIKTIKSVMTACLLMSSFPTRYLQQTETLDKFSQTISTGWHAYGKYTRKRAPCASRLCIVTQDRYITSTGRISLGSICPLNWSFTYAEGLRKMHHMKRWTNTKQK